MNAGALQPARVCVRDAALGALLRESLQDVPFDEPDTILAAFDGKELVVTYSRNGIEVSEERW